MKGRSGTISTFNSIFRGPTTEVEVAEVQNDLQMAEQELWDADVVTMEDWNPPAAESLRLMEAPQANTVEVVIESRESVHLGKCKATDSGDGVSTEVSG